MDFKKFTERYHKDADFRKTAIVKLSEALNELGVDKSILSESVADIDALNTELDIDGIDDTSFIFVSKTDSDKNSTSFIVGMDELEKLKNVRLMREFEEFKAFKEMKLNGKIK